ncbi:MAG TPA: CPBP family intramembrane glutamic endopeptidase [Pyrinomonadaceae bacterium]|nr:CPBP family intramembrane glutamic endopeptidase [Pyrinomonadaceae bacterium]
MVTEVDNAADLLTDEQSRKLARWEIVSVVTSGLIAEWVVLAFAGSNKLVAAVPILLALGFMFRSHHERGESLKELGFRIDNFGAACRLLLLPTVGVALLAVAFALFRSQPVFVAPWRNRFLLLPIWSLFQQYVLNGFLNRRAQLGIGKSWKSVILVALIFSLFHFPNPALAVVTFVGGMVWAMVYQRQPNLFALAFSHAIASVTLALTLPINVLNGLRVGFKYFGQVAGIPWF